ncbi:MAG: TPM domain-containing protein [Acidobacteriota bacterium]|nr:TPM domain-containing protein [Acidobacteriota bacterium]
MRVLLAVLLHVLSGAAPAFAQQAPPELTAPVNDFANVIDPGAEQQLDALIRQLQNATTDVMVVATVQTFKPWGDLPSYAVKMFENGGKGIGQKGKDNGVLIVLAVDDRQVRVEVGYDIEGFVTDGFAGEVSREVMVPFFRSGDYGQGLLAGATRIAQRIGEGRNVDLGLAPVAQRQSRRNTGVRIPSGTWIILLIIFLNLMRGGRRRRGRWTSGAGAFGAGFPRGGGGWGSSGGFGGGFGGFGGGRSGGGGGGASW